MISKINVFSTFPSAPRNQNLDIPSGSPWWWKAALSSNSHLLTHFAQKIKRIKSVAHKNGWTTSGYVMISPSNQGTRLEWREKSQFPNGKTWQSTKREKQTIRNCKKQTQGSKFACKMQPKRFPPYFTMLFCMVLHSILHLQWCLLDLFCTLIGLENTSLRWSKWDQEKDGLRNSGTSWIGHDMYLHSWYMCLSVGNLTWSHPALTRLKWGPRATAQCFAQPFVAHFGFHTMHLGMRLQIEKNKSKDIAGTLIPSGTSRTQRFAKLTLSKGGTIWFPGMLCHPKSNDSLEGSPVWRPHSAKVPGGWWRPVDRLEMLATGNDGPLEKVPSFKCYFCCLCWWCTLNFRGVNPKWSIWCRKETEN